MKKLENEVLYLDHQEVLSYIKNRPPLLMIEDAFVVPGEKAYSEKVLKEDEWFFKCHFPGNPMMPGVLQLESIFNASALPIKLLPGYQDKTTNIFEINHVKYKGHILPGSNIRISVEIKKFRRGIATMHGSIACEAEELCEADYVLVVLDDFIGVK